MKRLLIEIGRTWRRSSSAWPRLVLGAGPSSSVPRSGGLCGNSRNAPPRRRMLASRTRRRRCISTRPSGRRARALDLARDVASETVRDPLATLPEPTVRPVLLLREPRPTSTSRGHRRRDHHHGERHSSEVPLGRRRDSGVLGRQPRHVHVIPLERLGGLVGALAAPGTLRSSAPPDTPSTGPS